MTDLLELTEAQRAGRMRQVALLGIGTAAPRVVTQEEAIPLAADFSCETEGQRAWLKRVFTRAGVVERGTVLKTGETMDEVIAFYGPPTEESPHGPTTAARMDRYAAEASPLAERAARRAIAAAHAAAGDVTHLITVSCTGFYAPGIDVELIGRLGLRPDVRRIHIGFMGCHAMFNALAAAQDAVRADAGAVVLVCAVELSTLHFAYGWRPEKMVANALFADGASACVVGRPREEGAGGWTLLKTASMLLPESRDAMTWRIGDHGFEMTLSAELPNLIRTHLRPWCEAWLAEAGVGIADVRRWAIHPGGPRILGAAAESLGLSEDDLRRSRHVLERHGNMSSATLLFLLEEMAKDARPADDGMCVAIGFGPGLMAEGMLLSR